MNHLTTRLAIRLVLAIVSQTPVHAQWIPFEVPEGHSLYPDPARAARDEYMSSYAVKNGEPERVISRGRPEVETCVPSKLSWGCAPPSCIDPETGLTRMEDEKFACDGRDFGRARP